MACKITNQKHDTFLVWFEQVCNSKPNWQAWVLAHTQRYLSTPLRHAKPFSESLS